jgi:molybdopterin-guanine dinucleotide biosynthesis protein A
MPRASGIVLAGGASRRMGRDKRLLPIDGEPMLRRVVRSIASISDEVIVVTAPGRPLPEGVLDGLDARVVSDGRSEAGPLAGLEAGLRACRTDLAIVVAADMPWIDPGLLAGLLVRLADADADAVAVAGDRGPEPLLAAYRCGPVLASVTRLLDAGERRMAALLGALRVETISDAGGRSAVNVNEPADLARLAP